MTHGQIHLDAIQERPLAVVEVDEPVQTNSEDSRRLRGCITVAVLDGQGRQIDGRIEEFLDQSSEHIGATELCDLIAEFVI